MLKNLIYTIISLRIKKYGTYDTENVLKSIYYYAKLSNINLNKEEVLELIKGYNPNIIFEYLDLDKFKSEKVNPFKLPKNSVLRYAACPNLSPTIFNLKGLVLHKLFQLQNPDIKIYIRLDDTNPGNKSASLSTYRSYINATKWLGIQATFIYASNRLNRYYEVARNMIKDKVAYLDYGNKRSTDIDEFENFLVSKKGFVKCVVRSLKNTVLLRYVAKKHVIVKNTNVWPTYNFHSPIDEVDLGITHIYRGKDLKPSEECQNEILEYLNAPHIIRKYWGRNRFEKYSVHSSSIRAKKQDIYAPDNVVFENLKYYHITSTGLQGFFKELGLSNTDTVVNLGLLKKYQPKINCFIYNPVGLYLVKYTQHISMNTGYIFVDKTYRSFKRNFVFKHKSGFYKINPYNKLIKLLM